MLTDEQRADFERDGIIKLPGAFSVEQAARMQEVLWGELRRKYDIQRDDPSTWDRHDPVRLTGTKRHRAFGAMLSPVVRAALDDLFAPDGWRPPKSMGNVLVTMPSPGPWRVPWRIWHSDFGYTAPGPQPFVVKIWGLFDDVAPGGGGTPQLAGSHRVTENWLTHHPDDELEYKSVRDRILRSHPWLEGLIRQGDDDPRRNERLMVEGGDIDGVAVRVVECTGAAGDVYLTHGWVMHSIAENHVDRPRMMRSTAVFRLQESVHG